MSQIETEITEAISKLNRFDDKFLNERKVFLWGVVDDSSAKHVVNRLMYLESKDPGKEIKFYINNWT